MAKHSATVIVPCAGRPDFIGPLPKFLSLDYAGTPMVVKSVSKLNLKGVRLIISILKEHETRFRASALLKKFFPKAGVEICVLPASLGSQSGDVYQTIKKMKVAGPFLSKDSDNIFRMEKIAEAFNYVAVDMLENYESVSARDKSYVSRDTSGLIEGIEEKKIISNTFSMGGYYFTNPAECTAAYETLKKRYGKSGPNLYISRIISYLINERGTKFRIRQVSESVDFGTVSEWLAYNDAHKKYFIK
jgi:NDP-sugar pyrophosphorylase family protein